MASTYSTNLKIELQATGENSGTWGTITNTNLGTALEQAIVGYGNPNYLSDANLTLTYTNDNAAQTARALVLNVTSSLSLTATRELVVPTIQKQYIVQNNTTGSQSITVKTSAGTGITVPNGRKAHLYVNGTDVIFMDDFVDINGGAIDGTTIGANSAAAGNFTTVDATNVEVTNIKAKDGTAAASIADSTGIVSITANPVLSGGTANGVLYLDGSKVATSGSALTFDGTTFGVTSTWGSNSQLFTNATASNLSGIAARYNGANKGYLYFDNSTSLYNLYGEAGISLAFTANAAEGMRLTSTGLGIGTASPGAKLDVAGVAQAYKSGKGTINALDTASYAAGVGGTIDLGGNYRATGDYQAFVRIAAEKANAVNNDYGYNMGFYVTTNGGSTLGTKALTIDSSGNLGIGTTSPASALVVNQTVNSGTARIDLQNTGAGGSTDYSEFRLLSTAGTARTAVFRMRNNIEASIGSVTNDPFTFITNNTERARITAAGDVGIGTASPASKLDVNGIVRDSAGNVRAIPRTGSAKTTSYTLATADVGQFVEIGSGGSVTIPDATFATGDVVSIFNNTSGNVTITCTITTAYIAGTDADKATVTLATRGVATILFISGTVCVISGNVS